MKWSKIVHTLFGDVKVYGGMAVDHTVNISPDDLQENKEYWKSFAFKEGYWRSVRKLDKAIRVIEHLAQMYDSRTAYDALDEIENMK